MSVFRDSNGDEWRIQFDAFTLADTKKETGIDLADISAGGWQVVESDAAAVGRVLAVVCSEEIKSRKMTAKDFARKVRGEAIQRGRDALVEEAVDFFPPSEWSAIRANLTKRTQAAQRMEAATMAAKTTELIPLMEAFSKLSPEMQDKLLASGGAIPSSQSEVSESAFGPTSIPSIVATGSLESAEWSAVG